MPTTPPAPRAYPRWEWITAGVILLAGLAFYFYARATWLAPDAASDANASAVEVERAIAASDDLAQHRDTFVAATTRLVRDGRCSVQELTDQGGWVRSQNERRRPVYFTYCGGMRQEARLYLDAATGAVGREP